MKKVDKLQCSKTSSFSIDVGENDLYKYLPLACKWNVFEIVQTENSVYSLLDIYQRENQNI